MKNHFRFLQLQTTEELRSEFQRNRFNLDAFSKFVENRSELLLLAAVQRKFAKLFITHLHSFGLAHVNVESEDFTKFLISSTLLNVKRLSRAINKDLPSISEQLSELLIAVNSRPQRRFICKEKYLELSQRTHLMGVLNLTPDSFSDGGLFTDVNKAVDHALQMEADGADIIDIGGESTRPGAERISIKEELHRVMPVIERLVGRVSVPISIDTYKSDVAREALSAGVDIVNDISGLRFDAKMAQTAAKFGAAVIIMHIKGQPKNMQVNPHYSDLLGEIFEYLRDSKDIAMDAGISLDRIAIDPGLGFGKRLTDNYEILRRLKELQGLGCPILVGPSRKSFIGNVLNLPPDNRLEGTAAAVACAIWNGAAMVRVHDIKEMKRVVRIADLIVGKELFK